MKEGQVAGILTLEYSSLVHGGCRRDGEQIL